MKICPSKVWSVGFHFASKTTAATRKKNWVNVGSNEHVAVIINGVNEIARFKFITWKSQKERVQKMSDFHRKKWGNQNKNKTSTIIKTRESFASATRITTMPGNPHKKNYHVHIVCMH